MVITGYKENNIDVGDIYVTKEYIMEYYPDLVPNLKTPQLWSWGSGAEGKLGNNSTVSRSSPGTVAGGGTNSSGIKTDGTLWLWGSDSHGQLGDNSTVNRSSPVTTSGGGTNWKLVSAGYWSTAAIKTDGTLWTWGYNENGQLGNNSTVNRSSPGTVSGGGTNWKTIAFGKLNFFIAIKTDGTLWSCGYNYYGQLGNNSTVNRSSPGTVSGGGTNWTKISCSDAASCAIKSDGTLWTWGSNYGSVLGNNSSVSRSSPGTVSGGGTTWKEVSIAYRSGVAIKTDGTLWTWGYNTTGQLGNGTRIEKSSPVTVSGGGTNWKFCNMSTTGHCVAIKNDGTLWTWGSGQYGKLGNNSNLDKSSPVTVSGGGTNWKTLSSNSSFSTFAISEAEGW
jgi:alpha-tubulin suppressor-like RCC1 family protein